MKRPKILAVSLALAAAAVCVAAVLYFRSGTHPAGAREGLVVYIGTYGNHLYRYIFDASDGGFTPLGQAEVRNPSYIALGEENMRDGIYDIYAVSESGDSSGVFSFADNIGISRTGDAVTGEDPCYILFDNACSLVMTADYSGGSVSVFRVNDDGSVGEKLQTLRFEGSGPVPGRQESSHIHQLKFLPASASGRYLLVALPPALVVERCELARLHAKFLGYFGVCVSLFCYHAIQLVAFYNIVYGSYFIIYFAVDRVFKRLVAFEMLWFRYDGLACVVAVKFVCFYYFYQFVGIAFVGGIPTLAQCSCPTFIVGDFQLEQGSIAFLFQKAGMVFKRVVGRAITAEAFVGSVVIGINLSSLVIRSKNIS